jgi:hypothetical protein
VTRALLEVNMFWWVVVILCVFIVAALIWWLGRSPSMPEFERDYRSSLKESGSQEVALRAAISSLRSRRPFDELQEDDEDFSYFTLF